MLVPEGTGAIINYNNGKTSQDIYQTEFMVGTMLKREVLQKTTVQCLMHLQLLIMVLHVMYS